MTVRPKKSEPATPSVDAIIMDLAARYWRPALLAIIISLAGSAVNFHYRLSAVEEKLRHLPLSKVSEPFIVVHGIAEGDGQNRSTLVTTDVTTDIFEARLGPTTAERPTYYIELPPGRILTKIENNMRYANMTSRWTRLPGTQVWYYRNRLMPGVVLPVRFTSTLVQ